MKVIQFIRFNKYVRLAGFLSAVLLFVLSGLTIVPLVIHDNQTEAATGTSQGATLSLNVANATASVDLTVASANGTFAKSASGDEAAFSVTTNNYTGYTLSISASDDNGKLMNGTSYLESISNQVDRTLTDSTLDSSTYNGKWAYKPSTYYYNNATVDNTGVNAVYLISPTSSATTLDVTSVANNNAKNYTIALGARADYSKPAGTYTKTFTLTVVGNPISYTVDFDENTTDTVTNMPSTASGSTSSTSINLPSTVPVRAHYSFLGWCSIVPTTTSGVDSCTGTGAVVYNPNGAGTNLSYGIDQTTTNTATLYAMWSIDTYTCSKQYRLQAADGTYPQSYTSDTSETIAYGDTCTYSKSITDYKGNSGNDTALSTSQTVTGPTTLSLDFERNTYTVTVNRNTTYVSAATAATAAHGTNYFRWGQTVTVSATVPVAGEFLDWTQTSGDTVTFAVNTDATTTFTMPKSAVTVYAEALMRRIQNLDPTLCTTSGFMARDSRDDKEYLVKKLADNRCWMIDPLDIAGGTQLTWQDTNMDSSWSLSTGYGFLDGNRLPASNMSGFNSSTWAYVYNTNVVCNNTNTCGSYYSWTTATLGSGINIRAEDTDAPYSVCPKGWKLPNSRTTAAGNSDYYKLATAYGMSTGVISQNSGTVYTQAGYGTAANFILAGYGGWSYFSYNGEYAAMWSSTGMANADNARYFLLGPSIVNTAEIGYRNYGSQIRCLLIQ